MNKTRFFISLIVAAVMVFAPLSAVLAAPALEKAPLITGMVTFVKVSTDANTGITTVHVTVEDAKGVSQIVVLSLESAIALDLVYNNGEEVVIVQPLPAYIEIQLEDETQHPVGSALATFFADLEGIDYETIMAAHEGGNGFGVIAQALWLTRKIAGEGAATDMTQSIFEGIMMVKNGELTYADFYLAYITNEDGTPVDEENIPTNWGQFKKAMSDGDKKANLGAIMSAHNEDNGGTPAAENAKGKKDKDKKNDHSNNGNGRGRNR